MDFYKFALTNSANYLRKSRPSDPDGNIDAWQISSVLSIVFCKSKEEILQDLVLIKLPELTEI